MKQLLDVALVESLPPPPARAWRKKHEQALPALRIHGTQCARWANLSVAVRTLWR